MTNLRPGDKLGKIKDIPRLRRTFTPVGCLVAIQPIKADEMTEKGIVIPEISRDRYKTPIAFVIAVGPECKQLKEGDVVLATINGPAEKAWVGNVSYIVCREEHIMGVLDPAEIDKQRVFLDNSIVSSG